MGLFINYFTLVCTVEKSKHIEIIFLDLFTYQPILTLMTKDQELIEGVKMQNNEALREVYLQHKQHFLAFFSRYNLSADDILDVYQDSIVAFCENVRKGKLDAIKSSIATYIFAIGKYKVYALLKKDNRTSTLEFDINDMDIMQEDDIEEDNRIHRVKKAFQDLGSKCKEILTMFYYEEKKLDEIQQLMQYENKDVLKSQKSRCLKRLKELTEKL